jgi:hypothetical protein
MCTKILSFLAFVAVFNVPVSPSQDKLEAEEILGWFPEGYYQSISHTDFSGVPEEELALFKELVGDLEARKQESWPLPDSMIRSVVSFTSANLSNYREIAGEEQADEAAAGKTQKLANILVSFVDDNGDRIHLELEDRAVELFVFRLENPDNSFKRTVAAGEISDTGEKRFERSIYTFVWRTGGEFYLYPTVTGEVLVTTELPALRKMIDAGMGQGQSVIDDPDQRNFIEMLPTLGHSWMKNDSGTRLRAQLKTAEKQNAPEEYIDEIQERLNKLPVVNCSSSHIGVVTIQKTIGIYVDEAVAEEAYNQAMEATKRMYAGINALPEPNRSLMMNDRRNRTITRDKNVVTMEVKFDREYLELIK